MFCLLDAQTKRKNQISNGICMSYVIYNLSMYEILNDLKIKITIGTNAKFCKGLI